MKNLLWDLKQGNDNIFVLNKMWRMNWSRAVCGLQEKVRDVSFGQGCLKIQGTRIEGLQVSDVLALRLEQGEKEREAEGR